MQNRNLEYAVNWLVRSVSDAVETIVEAGRKGDPRADSDLGWPTRRRQ
jgi:hypothetical protein